MGYDISLNDPVTGEVLELDVPHHMRGSTYQVGGTTRAWLSVTYNYASHFYAVLGEDGIRTLYGKSGAQSIPLLRSAADKLKDDVSSNYWDSTEGNAKAALMQLLALAQMRPDGVWDGD
ncbi:hypothetical protein [Sinimarinibacterium sp. NLF-5-8]|uniref:hypothetical protein n=1 Tax=Sinimarinibacterium sp. NLF-5-8 TaxID=2698684 RepID=UPI00137BADF6|nr:hypothetical protein [Sinimarinibacterium sp. NLF-5-8]QHS09126.1 hypothetical protein GT972_02460 [Sinimarinibacterium sp. NLF-5-8]